jgi:hypothetical protein
MEVLVDFPLPLRHGGCWLLLGYLYLIDTTLTGVLLIFLIEFLPVATRAGRHRVCLRLQGGWVGHLTP